jgi:YfdX protein
MTQTVDTSKDLGKAPVTARTLSVQAQAGIEKQRAEARQEADKILDREAISVIEETQRAIDAIAANTTSEALAALERASGKIDILLARNPSTALIPVSHEVVVFDTAPQDIQTIDEIGEAVDAVIASEDYPAARELLYGLMSELRVRTYNLPLATYPAALAEAARLLDQKKSDEARIVLMMALGTLLAIDQVTPLPLLVAREAINQAEAQRDKDKEIALALLDTARYELDRAMALGYSAQEPEYKTMKDDISNIQKQLKKNNEDTSSFFSKLQDRLSAFMARLSKGKQSRHDKSQPKQSQPEKRAA